MRIVSELFDQTRWVEVPGFESLSDITYHRSTDGRIARIAFDRPEVRNAFRPQSVDELYRCFDDARLDTRVGVVLLTGNGRAPRTAAGRSAPEATSASEVAAGTSTRTAPPASAGCTSSRCSA